LERKCYQGLAFVHWNLTFEDQATGWRTERFHLQFRELLLHTAAREDLFCPVYCLMPDHIHFVWMGLCADTDQLNGMSFLRTQLKPLILPHELQHQAFDHVLDETEREDDAFAAACAYIVENPVRAKLVEQVRDWPHTGCVVPGYPTLHPLQPDYWDKLWRLYRSRSRRGNEAG
jgi:putative transposase